MAETAQWVPCNREVLGARVRPTVLGIAYEAEGKTAQAKTEYRRALALDPSDADAHLDCGTVLPLKKSRAQELEAVQLDPQNAAAQKTSECTRWTSASTHRRCPHGWP